MASHHVRILHDDGVRSRVHCQLFQWFEHKHMDGLGLLRRVHWRSSALAVYGKSYRLLVHPAATDRSYHRLSTTRSLLAGSSLPSLATTTSFSNRHTSGSAFLSPFSSLSYRDTYTRRTGWAIAPTTSTLFDTFASSILVSSFDKNRLKKWAIPCEDPNPSPQEVCGASHRYPSARRAISDLPAERICRLVSLHNIVDSISQWRSVVLRSRDCRVICRNGG